MGIQRKKKKRRYYLGIWQLKDLKDPMSNAEAAGSIELDKFMLEEVATEGSDESLMASVAILAEKAAM